MRKIDTLLFDLDDTLIVEVKSAKESFIETIKQTGYPVNIDEFLKEILKQAKEEWHKLPTIDYCRKIQVSSWEALWADFTGDHEHLAILRELAPGYRFRTWNQTLVHFNIKDSAMAEKLSLDFKRIRNTKHILYPETIDVLTKLKSKFKLGLITNGAPDLQWKKINGGNLKSYFNFIAISGEHGYAKPDSRLFDKALEGLNSTKEHTIMIGDTLNSDIKGAGNYGIKTIWINRNSNKADGVNPDYEVSSLRDIFKILS